MKYLIIFLLFVSNILYAQLRGLRGFVFDSSEKKPLPDAHIVLSSIPLEDFPYYTTTNEKGYFEFRRVVPGKYLLEITFIGYEKYFDTIQIGWSGKSLDTIYLKQSALNIGEVYVIEKIPQVEQKGDTLEFNAAAFKTAPNSTLEELVLKLPGVEKEDNTIKVQGEEVKKVLVDGRRFFGNDPEIALKNLPADIVEKIQLFDKKSEQAELTGFEDDQTEKTFNVVTKIDKRQGSFGKLYGGYGTTDRYNSGINYNTFKIQERISLLGIGNNINQAGFSSEDLSSSEQFSAIPAGRSSRGRGRIQNNPLLNVPINFSEGNNDIYAFGINYSNVFAAKLELNGSYFFNRYDNRNNTNSFRKYLSELSGLDRYNERIYSNSKNFDHRINFFADYRVDTLNIFRMRPEIQFTLNRISTFSFAENYLINQLPLNAVSFDRINKIENFNLNNDFVYSHRFLNSGRTFSIGINTIYSKRLSDYDLTSQNTSFTDSLNFIDTLNQSSYYNSRHFNSTINLNFTEMIGERSFLRIRFNPFYTEDSRIRNTYKSDSIISNRYLFDSLYSNSLTNKNLALRGSLSYRYNSNTLNIEIDFMYQNYIRKGLQIFPQKFESVYQFNAVLPSFELNYRPSEFQRLRIEYNRRVQIPSIIQLQNTIDFSNPNFLKRGNPDLKQMVMDNLNIKYFLTDPEKGNFNAYSFNLLFSRDNFSNNTIVFTKDSILPGNILISRGTQLSYPVNTGNSINFSINSTNSFKILLLESNLSFSTFLGFSRSPNLISGKENITHQYNISENITLSSNNHWFDYRLTYFPNFTYLYNSLNRRVNRIIIQKASLYLKTRIWSELYFGTRINYFSNTAASNIEKKSTLVWNISMSYLLFPDNTGELKLEIIDLLNQKRKIDRIIREEYFEDRNTTQLARFIMLSFIYNLRSFN